MYSEINALIWGTFNETSRTFVLVSKQPYSNPVLGLLNGCLETKKKKKWIQKWLWIRRVLFAEPLKNLYFQNYILFAESSDRQPSYPCKYHLSQIPCLTFITRNAESPERAETEDANPGDVTPPWTHTHRLKKCVKWMNVPKSHQHWSDPERLTEDMRTADRRHAGIKTHLSVDKRRARCGECWSAPVWDSRSCQTPTQPTAWGGGVNDYSSPIDINDCSWHETHLD